jgi:aminopeptidase N
MMKNLRITSVVFLFLVAKSFFVNAQTDKCSNNAARSWWDVQHYALNLEIDTASGYITGSVEITAKVNGKIGDSLQIDLQEPLKILSIAALPPDYDVLAPDFSKNGNAYPVSENNVGLTLSFVKQGSAYYVTGDMASLVQGNLIKLKVQYEGVPQIAARPPWDGGLVLDRDKNGKRWMAMACQGVGASVWFPCKDFQGDEPDKGMQLTMTIPKGLTMVGNGKCLIGNMKTDPGKVYWTWSVANPINNYDISFYIGDYVHWSDTLNGEKGKLSLDYWVLRDNLTKAKKQFAVVKPMLRCFESKMGPYPFYEDGYKLVDAPYLGMEHQSAVAYGNGYKMGYKGLDRSKTGVGLTFDFIIIHESGHEWFGNNITTYDKADTWVHEGFTSYTETIFAECLRGKEEAFKYQRGKRGTIHNDMAVLGKFNECDEGSSDHYDKGAFMIHMIRMIMDDDAKFFGMLREMNHTFYHKIVTGKEIEEFMSTYAGKDFGKIYDQYLRSKDIPKLELKQQNGNLMYRWVNCVTGFDMPVSISVDGKKKWIYPQTEWGSVKGMYKKILVSKDFLID